MGFRDHFRNATDWLNVPRKQDMRDVATLDDEIRAALVAKPTTIFRPSVDQPVDSLSGLVQPALPPPFPIHKRNTMGGTPITGADSIQALIYNSFQNVIVNLAGRVVMQDGSLRNLFLQVKPRSDRTVVDVRLPFPDGADALLNFTATTPNSTLTRGQCFVSARIVSSGQIVPTLHPTVLQGSPNVVQTLIQDYIMSGHIIQWPGGRIISSIEPPGFANSAQAPGSALGTGSISVTVPDGARWILRGTGVKVSTDATAITRYAQLTLFIGGGGGAFVITDPFGLGASTQKVTIAMSSAGFSPVTENPTVISLYDDCFLLAGDKLIWQAFQGVIGDTISQMFYIYEEFIEPGQF